jgi:hypothetical protein|tara:strand:- start:102 stop:440 length:339 start_codon:yes stop_codon:yes gene_type:complete
LATTRAYAASPANARAYESSKIRVPHPRACSNARNAAIDRALAVTASDTFEEDSDSDVIERSSRASARARVAVAPSPFFVRAARARVDDRFATTRGVVTRSSDTWMYDYYTA